MYDMYILGNIQINYVQLKHNSIVTNVKHLKYLYSF